MMQTYAKLMPTLTDLPPAPDNILQWSDVTVALTEAA